MMKITPNTESLMMLLKYAGLMLIILVLIYGMALLTPVIAKKIDAKRRKKSPEKVEKIDNDVIGIYDAQEKEKINETDLGNKYGDEDNGKG